MNPDQENVKVIFLTNISSDNWEKIYELSEIAGNVVNTETRVDELTIAIKQAFNLPATSYDIYVKIPANRSLIESLNIERLESLLMVPVEPKPPFIPGSQ